MDAAQAPRIGRVFALIDGNSFYCSCERAFAPALNGRPVIVLSNNDGCAVARTPEAKALGIAMGAPFFKIRDLCRKNQVAVFSSNYTLYGDMSSRMNEIYHQFAPEVEVYSIDESFLDITGLGGGSYVAYGQQLRQTVRTWTGIPTCVGIGPTKTLAKLANRTAKNHAELNGVCDFSDLATREKYLPATSVGELWGIGGASAAKLKAIGVETVGQLRALDPKRGRQLLTVVGERTIHELNGIACLALETLPVGRKGIAVTRSFGRPVTSLVEMQQAVAAYATRAAEKLRRHGLCAVQGVVFMHTNAFNGDKWSHTSKAVEFLEPTDDTQELVAAATRAAATAWREGYRYAKAGIMLTELVPLTMAQTSLLATIDRAQRDRLNQALDAINLRFGRHTLVPAAAGLKQAWSTKFERKSPCFTTRWKELPKVAA
ncbi:Y-family DNA polymerase (plasmid) [Mesorhizobium loti]|uniref:DNA-directed DNA polymerase n=1 Tax=Mesorhizobium jarvisii TaxID=1777867 RepID=A0A6M7TRN6_9HYPH|nr:MULTISPECIES: Y-family DNA polymerase [Mesorhizobium]OBQ66505.1 DNA polymerase V subunit UmuC [Mesorhizobium loti]QKC67664.1 Y-family DNA polymerase [Mesorhizobium jarvisii]QKD13573.1 Y-family DNA polymerase [Mesorhizobium loti]RJT28188.1 Y-family DNA polymerase [Mesorhizobium jarvisii]